MTIIDRYLAYAADFDKSYVDDDWSRIAQYFTADAAYENEPAARGRDAVLAKFKSRVDGFDRTMRTRTVQFQPATAQGNTVTVRWTASYTSTGKPDLAFSGTEFAVFQGECIANLRDELDAGAQEAIGAWMAAHGGARQSG